MYQVNIHEAKTNLSKLIQKALNGEEVIIAKGNKPVVRLEPLPGAKPERSIGTVKDFVVHMADDFDEPLEDFKDYM